MPKGTRFLRLLPCVSVKSATRRAASSHDIKVKNDSGGVFARWLYSEFIAVKSLQWQWGKKVLIKKAFILPNISFTHKIISKILPFINITSSYKCLAWATLPSVCLTSVWSWIQPVSTATIFFHFSCHLAQCVLSAWVTPSWSIRTYLFPI